MSKHVLFVCKSCNSVHSNDVDYNSAEGSILLKQLLNMHQNYPDRDELDIRAVGCLWTCSSPCAVAFSGTNKAIYLFTNVPATEVEALLQFGHLYSSSKDGRIPRKKFPEALQLVNIARIPSERAY